jgi:CheY-like chemotaxis protein
MPKMNGLEATRQIRELGYVGKIYGVTGNALAEDVADFIRHGADAVRIKPVSKVGILEMLKGAYFTVVVTTSDYYYFALEIQETTQTQ